MEIKAFSGNYWAQRYTLGGAMDVPSLTMYFAIMSITPGPNNVMVTASGAVFGYRATLPHILGIGLGLALQIVIVAMGLGILFLRIPILHSALAIAGAIYLFYLAWQLLTSGAIGDSESRRPFTIWQGILFQACNPKAWVMAITTVAVFLPPNVSISAVTMVAGGLFLAVNIPCVSIWALFGSGMRHLLLLPTYRWIFNLTMSISLMLTALLSLRD